MKIFGIEEQVLIEPLYRELWKQSIISIGRTSPNPAVACVLTDDKYNIIASGSTEAPGNRHAEIVALDQFDKLKVKPQNIYVFVTLEPCSTYGRTPPCTLRIKNYKNIIKKIYIENLDLTLKNSGINSLSESGIQTERISIFNLPHFALSSFNSIVLNQRPQYFLKVTTDESGIMGSTEKKIQITGKEGSIFTMILRAKCDAVIVGPGTVRIDLPRLDVRWDDSKINYTFEDLYKKSIIQKKQDEYFDEFLRGIFLFYKEILEETKFYDYQPYRIFILGKYFPEFLNFYQKQIEITKQTKKPFYFFVQEKYSGEYNLNLVQKEYLQIIPNMENPNFFQFLNRFLHSLGVQKVLIESGKKMFDFFVKFLNSEDRIYYVKLKKNINVENPVKINLNSYSLKKIDFINLENICVYSYQNG